MDSVNEVLYAFAILTLISRDQSFFILSSTPKYWNSSSFSHAIGSRSFWYGYPPRSSIILVFSTLIHNPTFAAALSRAMVIRKVFSSDLLKTFRSSTNLESALGDCWPLSPLASRYIILTDLSSTKLNNSRDNASPCFKPVSTVKASDNVLSTLTWYFVPSMHILVSITNLLGISKSYIILYRLSLCML